MPEYSYSHHPHSTADAERGTKQPTPQEVLAGLLPIKSSRTMIVKDEKQRLTRTNPMTIKKRVIERITEGDVVADKILGYHKKR